MKQEKQMSNIHRTGILATLLAAAFISSMSTTVTANMIPNLMVYFNVSSSAAQWLTSGSTLLSGIIIPITAFLIKKVPNRIYFILAMGAFTAGSLSAYLAANFQILLASRLIQALGCGMLLSFAQIIILSIYPKEKHGTMMAAYSMAASVSSMVGPTYAGLLMDSVGWRGVFISLFAAGAFILIAGTLFMRNVTPKQDADINMLYVILSSVGFAAFIIGLNNMKSGAVRLQSGGLMLAGILSLTAFSVLQLRSDKPMLNLRVFQYPAFRISLALSMCLYLICMGNAVILPILAKIICGFSDTAYGLATIVGALISVFATLFAGKIYDKLGIRPMAIISVVSFSMFTLSGILTTDSSSLVYIGILYALQSIAMAMLLSPATTMALSGLDQQIRVDGSAIFNTLRQISSSIASTVAVLLLTVLGNDLNAIHGVYVYFGVVTVIVAFLVITYIAKVKKS